MELDQRKNQQQEAAVSVLLVLRLQVCTAKHSFGSWRFSLSVVLSWSLRSAEPSTLLSEPSLWPSFTSLLMGVHDLNEFSPLIVIKKQK